MELFSIVLLGSRIECMEKELTLSFHLLRNRLLITFELVLETSPLLLEAKVIYL